MLRFNFFIILLAFCISNNAFSQEGIAEISSSKAFVREYVPFAEDLIWNQNAKKKDPYDHYFSVSFAPFFFRETFGNRFQVDDLYFVNFAYGQYASLLRIPGRFTIEFGGMFGKAYLANDVDKAHVGFGYLGAMYEFMFNLKWFYFNVGLGAYIANKNHTSRQRLGSNFLFGQKIGIGKVFAERYDVELFFRHFSNGNLQLPNNGFNMIGLQFGLRI